MSKREVITISFIILIYTIISFINLGSTKNPETFWKSEYSGENVIIKLSEEYVQNVKYYNGVEPGEYKLYTSLDGRNYFFFENIEKGDCFEWNEIACDRYFQYVKIEAQNSNTYIGEIAFYNGSGEQIKISAVDESAEAIIDEQNIVPKKINFMNSTYFDEVYHANFAYRYVNSLEFYDVHPPLGKLIIAASIALFGMNPFAYRLMGNIAGILMILVIYIMAKDMFKDKKYGYLAAIIMALDNFHFAQTRIATLDSFLVLFIMLSFMFMYKYVILDRDEKLKKKLLMLFLSGLFMGLAIATKWTGCFAAIGLAIIFFSKFLKNIFIKEASVDKEKIVIEFNKDKKIKEIVITVLSCIVFFVAIPVVIYCLCYIPHEGVDSLKDIWDLQVSIYNYHSDLEAEHPYTSKWYTWFIMQRPVWYYLGSTEVGTRSTIAAIGNPLIWWVGLISMIYVLLKGIFKFKKECFVIIIAVFTAILPYLFIDRIMFLYHYFPVLPFMMLSIVMLIKDIESKIKFKYIGVIYGIIILATFIYFYPVVSGMEVSNEYIESTRWLDSWYY